MFRLVQVCVRRASVLGSARTVTRQLGSRTGTRTRDRVRSCTVDSNLEEQFVFPEFTGPEDDPPQDRDLIHHLTPLSPSPSPCSAPPPPQRHLRSLERQLQVLSAGAQKEAEPDSLIQFQDVDFPLDQDLVSAETKRKKKKKKAAAGKGEHKVFGTADVDEPVSDTVCSGCGALLHCAAAAAPGFLPSEKYKALLAAPSGGGLRGAVCQRCHLLTHHRRALELTLPRQRVMDVLARVRPLTAPLVLLVVDLLELPDSVPPDLPQLVGTNKHVVVLGNKIDLLPGDAPGYLRRIRQRLARCCDEAGFGSQVTDLHLVSAKTGYGIEPLISSLQRSWKYRGDVYLVGGANAGKSTLFNALLDSDFCKSKASDLIHKATVSPWPGTTLNLLKFPIINPTPDRMFRRRQRLEAAAAQTEEELTAEEQRRLKTLSRGGYLIGRVGRTFRSDVRSRSDEIQFDPDSLALGETDQEETTGPSPPAEEFSYNELKDARWLFDTPGILKENDILSLLNEQEVRSVVPTQAVVPRTFVLKPGTSLFIGALARIDFLEGNKSCWFSVMASARVPVHITSLEKADAVYEKHAGHVLLGVPAGGAERMKRFPALVPQEFRLQGRGHDEAAADVTLSSAGWVAVTAVEGDDITLRVHHPESVAFGLRTPPLLPHVVSLKGRRVGKSCSYKPMKKPAGGGQLDGGLAPGGGGARGLQVVKKKKKEKKK